MNAEGEILELKSTINIMVEQLSSFAAEVTRVAREVGTEGKLGGQAVVRGVGGIWKDLTDNVNQMGTNLTDQVRGIAKVVTAVAQGDLKKKLTVQAKGEIAELSETINNMIDTLATFAEQVTGVAREVGVEGRLGGQANVPGAAGTWKDLTDNVNQLAANLTTQVRAISEVATAVTKGDLSRSIGVEAQGEVAWLKDIINKMILNLKETTLKNSEQDWLKTNLAKFTRILQGQKDIILVARLILSELAPMVSSHQGLFYIMDNSKNEPLLKMLAAYAFKERKNVSTVFRIGEGLVGQCAYEKERILLTKVPLDYISISSGLGEAPPLNIVVLPIIFEGQVKAVIEIASFEHFSSTGLALLDQLAEIFGIVLNTIETHSRTEELLKQSQNMAQELQSQQEELQQTNEQLEEKAKLLATQNSEVAEKNRQIEIARVALEEKAKQLTLTSKYKSEFLANMSHELRTPLNSLLILSRQLSDNKQGNLTDKQIEFAKTIHAAGSDLCALINDILDLSKIESGTVSVEINSIQLPMICNDLERMFRHIAESKNIAFKIDIVENTPRIIETDFKRLLQIFKNLLSNAFKFTEKGEVIFKVEAVQEGFGTEHPILSKVKHVMAFSVRDTGIGIPIEKQGIIFEAFQQADGTTSRRYGGTGLGLSISRELAHLLGGEIRLKSEPAVGSTFTLYLPQAYTAPSIVKGILSEGSYIAEKMIPEFMQADTLNEILEEIKSYHVPHAYQNLLLVESDKAYRDKIIRLVSEDNIQITVCDTASEAITLLKENLKKPFDCIILELNAVEGLDLLKFMDQDPYLRSLVIVSTDKELTKEEEQELIKSTENFKAKNVISKEQLLSQILSILAEASNHIKNQGQQGLSLLRTETYSNDKTKMIVESKNRSKENKKKSTRDDRSMLAGKTLLIVDDDPRNIFAVSSALENHGITVLAAENGKEAILILNTTPAIDAILMDIMMPEMDGYQTMAEIRHYPKYMNLPIIALTAKAMKGDKEKCIAAGATDYLSKPIDIQELLSMLSKCLSFDLESA